MPKSSRLLIDQKFVSEQEAGSKQREFYDTSFKARGSFGLRISPGGTKAYFLVYRIGGVRRRITLGLHPTISAKQACTDALEILRRVQAGLDPKAFEDLYGSRLTFGRLVDTFDSEHITQHCKSKTAAEYRRIIRRYLYPAWENRSLQAINQRDLQRLMQRISKGEQHPVIANRVRALSSKIFNFAIGKGFLENNPAEQVSPFYIQEKEKIAISKAQLKTLFKDLRKQETSAAKCLSFLLLSGQRLGHVSQLKWEEIRLGHWHVPNRESAPLVMSAPLIKILESCRNDGEYVFSENTSLLYNQTRALCRELGEGSLSLNSLNASTVRKGIELGLHELEVPLITIARIMGFTALEKRLARFKDELDPLVAQREALEAWALYLGSPTPSQLDPNKSRNRFAKNKDKEEKPTSAKVIQLFGEEQ